jgi:mannose-1-phosphate guanylyltransferase
MAGGRGQRFWPLSTEDRPKQFLDLEDCGRTLLQSTFDRLRPTVQDIEHVFVATTHRYVKLVQEQLPDIPRENILVEPVGRDSAPAVCYASLAVESRFGDALTGFFPSDHRIGNVSRFHEVLGRAVDVTEKTRGITTIGIKPHSPATGFGYIQTGQPYEGNFEVSRFVEKPDKPQAKEYLQAGNFFWNAGMFLWHTSTILAELERYAPELLTPLEQAFCENRVHEVFPKLPKISIDYAVLEKTDNAYVVPGFFEWDDIGDWAAFERLMKSGRDETNTVIGQHIGHETRNSIIYLEDKNDVMVTLGVEDLVVVKRGKAILVTPKDRVQDIKHLLKDRRISDLVAG